MPNITYEDIQRVNSEITTVPIQGKEYAEVPQRVSAFRKLFPMGTITTDIISMQDGVVVMKAVVSVDGVVLGEGLAYEKEGNGFINRNSYVENCQTSAVGRALGFLGIGSDTSIASVEEVLNAKKQQSDNEEEEKRSKVKRLLEETNSDVPKFLEWASEKCMREIKAVDEMKNKELDLVINQLEYTKKNGRGKKKGEQ